MYTVATAAMASHRCEKVHFPFTAKEPTWAAQCLAVTRDEAVRVVRKEPNPGLWCIAQNKDGAVGLLPTLILKRAKNAREDSMLSAGIRSEPRTARRLYMDPLAALPHDGVGNRLVGGGPLDDGHNSHSLEEPAAADTPTDMSTVSSSTDSTTSAADNSATNHDAREAFSTPRAIRGHCRGHVFDAAAADDDTDVELLDEIAARSRASRDRSATKRPVDGSPGSSRSVAQTAWSYPDFCRDDPEARDLFTQLLVVRAETARLAHLTHRVDGDVGVAELSKAEERAVGAKRQAALEEELAKQKARVEALKIACDGVDELRKALEAELRAAHDASALTDATTNTATRTGVLSGHDPNVSNNVGSNSQHPSGKDASADVVVAELVRCERETLASYRHQADLLKRRQEKVTRLAAQLREESCALAHSEAAISAVVAANARADGKGGNGDAATMVHEWPQTLAGLTDEEAEALANYVRLSNKYTVKRAAIEAEAPQLVAANRLQKLQSRVAKGDAEVEKMTEELKQLRLFVDKHGPVAARLEEQLKVGYDVLAKKKACLDTLNGAL